MPTALITGITGQTGSYLAELLLEKGYRVAGLVRRISVDPYGRLQSILPYVEIHQGDLLDQSSLDRVIKLVKPDEVYNLAAQSFVGTSWEQPVLTGEVTGLGVTRILNAIRSCGNSVKFYQSSSSEQFGKVAATPQNESTPFYPRSPYGVAKVYAHWLAVNYRESYDMFNCCGIAYNHESERRGAEFVTRKITKAVAAIKKGKQHKLLLGNLSAKRDWSHASDVVKAMWLILQQDKPSDYVIASEETHTVEEFVRLAFQYVDLNWCDYVEIDPNLYRPAEVDILLGNASKIKHLGWRPSVSFSQLVQRMVEHDLNTCV